MMRAGELDRLVAVEKKQVSKDAATGAAVVTWVAHASNVWAAIDETATPGQRGDERLQGAVQVIGRPAAARLRWVDGVDASMRINDGGTLWQIVSIARIGRQEGLNLMLTAWSHE